MADNGDWWARTGNFVPYPSLRQADLPHCVYASVAGAINHLLRREVWTPKDLLAECQRQGQDQASFGVADVALTRVPNEVEKLHHNTESSSERLSASLVRQWIDDGGVVILSMEQGNGAGGRQGAWHMFSLVARDEARFQVWDTNGGQQVGLIFFEGRGFLTEEEIAVGIPYPNGWFFMPHDKEDTLVLKPTKSAGEDHA